MASSPLVSVIMPVYNGERYLPQAIESILCQTLRDFELLILNDGSTDGTAPLIERYARVDSRLRVYHQENRGLIAALNRLLALSQGPYVARMDADDISLPHRLEAQLNFLEANPSVALVGGAIELIDSLDVPSHIVRFPTSAHAIRRTLLHHSCFAHPAVMMRKDAVQAVGGYRKCFAAAEDYDLWLRLAERFQLANLQDPVLQYRVHPHQITSQSPDRPALSLLAAQAAARMRHKTGCDPLGQTETITPGVLAAMGVSVEAIQKATTGLYAGRANLLLLVGEREKALQLLDEAAARSRKLTHDRHLLAALSKGYSRVYLQQGKAFAALVSGAKACMLEPSLILQLPKKGLRCLLDDCASVGRHQTGKGKHASTPSTASEGVLAGQSVVHDALTQSGNAVLRAATSTTSVRPLVSIVTPTYNRAPYLEETIESVLTQDYPAVEYIVLDDGSTDNTIEVLSKYADRLIWQSHLNMGETRTVNKGLSMAHGEIIAVVNSDDPLLPGAISEGVAFLEAHPDILVAYPDWNLIDQGSKVIEHIQVREYDYLCMVKRHRGVVGPGAFVRRRAIELAGLRDPSFKYVADLDFWLRVGLHGPFARIPRTLATFRVHPDSASESCRGREMAEEHIRLLEKFFSLPNLPAAVHQARSEASSWAHHVAGITAGKARRTAWEHLVKAVRYYPRGILSQWTLIADVALPNRLLQRLRQARRRIRSVLKRPRGAVR